MVVVWENKTISDQLLLCCFAVMEFWLLACARHLHNTSQYIIHAQIYIHAVHIILGTIIPPSFSPVEAGWIMTIHTVVPFSSRVTIHIAYRILRIYISNKENTYAAGVFCRTRLNNNWPDHFLLFFTSRRPLND